MKEDCFHLGIKAVIRNEFGKVLLLEINPSSLKDFAGPKYWDLPGGRIHRGATVEETLRREVFEETGISEVRSIMPLAMVLSSIRIPPPPDVGLILWLYLCEAPTTSNILLSDEHLRAKWFSPTKAASLLSVKYPKPASDAIRAIGSS